MILAGCIHLSPWAMPRKDFVCLSIPQCGGWRIYGPLALWHWERIRDEMRGSDPMWWYCQRLFYVAFSNPSSFTYIALIVLPSPSNPTICNHPWGNQHKNRVINKSKLKGKKNRKEDDAILEQVRKILRNPFLSKCVFVLFFCSASPPTNI